MAETYQFVWGEVEIIEAAIASARAVNDNVNYAHIETTDYDLDIDRIGIRITVPHDKSLAEQREPI